MIIFCRASICKRIVCHLIHISNYDWKIRLKLIIFTLYFMILNIIKDFTLLYSRIAKSFSHIDILLIYIICLV